MTYIKKSTLPIAFVISIIFMMASCNNKKAEDSKEIAEEKNENNFENNQEDDSQFLVNAAEINLEEIQLAKLAQQIGKTQEIKDLGKMMEDAHTKSLKDLNALALSKNMSIPSSLTEDAQDAYKTMNEYSADEFDKAYSNMIVSAHNDAIEVFEDAASESSDADIKNWAAASLPELRAQLAYSIEIQKKFANMYLEKNN